jgi:RNA-directed DNA polymerase
MRSGNADGAKGGRKMDVVEKIREGKKSAAVVEIPKQAEETEAVPPWVELSVWTPRMWTALQDGVKGGQWFSLIDKVWKRKNLESAYGKVARNRGCAGVDHISVSKYGQKLDYQLDLLRNSLIEGRYRTQALLRKHIPKEGGVETRPLSIPSVRDRVVHTATKQVIEPIFEKMFSENSFGFRPGRSNKDALRATVEALKSGKLYVVDADISKCFDTIPHEPLLERIGEQISDSRMMKLIGDFLKQGIMEAGEQWEAQEGTPQGGPLSPLLANIYLNPVDWLMHEKGYTSIRFADDIVILCEREEEARAALEHLREWMRGNGLSLNPDKTRMVDMNKHKAYFEFLGYKFYRTTQNRLRWFARAKSKKKLRSKIRPLTKRCNGHSMDEIIRKLNPILRGWFEYFKHSLPSDFQEVDGWVRMRLRSILRKRHKGRGRGHGSDHTRWPNAYFLELGLFSLVAARESLRSSASR